MKTYDRPRLDMDLKASMFVLWLIYMNLCGEVAGLTLPVGQDWNSGKFYVVYLIIKFCIISDYPLLKMVGKYLGTRTTMQIIISNVYIDVNLDVIITII